MLLRLAPVLLNFGRWFCPLRWPSSSIVRLFIFPTWVQSHTMRPLSCFIWPFGFAILCKRGAAMMQHLRALALYKLLAFHRKIIMWERDGSFASAYSTIAVSGHVGLWGSLITMALDIHLLFRTVFLLALLLPDMLLPMQTLWFTSYRRAYARGSLWMLAFSLHKILKISMLCRSVCFVALSLAITNLVGMFPYLMLFR